MTDENPKTLNDLPILLFETEEAWAAWLEDNRAKQPGIWVRLAKKASGRVSIDYDQALRPAICFGWIDSLKKSYDNWSWLQKFTPRRPRSNWSKRNRRIAEGLIEAGRMQEEGLREVEAAKADGRWQAAYDSPATAVVPADFQAELDKRPAAATFFATLNSRNRYAILYRIQSVKRPETRAKHIANFITMLENEEKPLP